MKHVDALVVGAGPTGLTLACDLARRGLTVSIVERLPEPRETSRAVAVQARTLELLEPLGVVDRLLERGKVVGGITVWAGGEPVVRAELEELESRFAHVLVVSQTEVETLLVETLLALGVAVERGKELVAVRQDGTGVTARLRRKDLDAEEEVRAAWLLAADGADGVVGGLLEVPFEAEGFDDEVVVADVRLAWDLRDDRVHAFLGEAGLFVCFPMREGRHRVIATLPLEARARDGEPTLDDLQSLMALHTTANGRLSEPTWIARHRVRGRQLARYRDDRVLFAGDAAQVHSPFGGQGMNAGIQDALNLGWKLAAVHRGHARGLLLDTYHEERHAAGRHVLRGAEAVLRVAGVKSPTARATRDELGRFLGSLEVFQQRLAKEVAEFSVTYEKSTISREDRTGLLHARIGSASGGETPTIASVRDFAAGPAAGHRAPDGRVTVAGRQGTRRLYELLDGKRSALLLFDGRSDSPEGYARFADIIERVGAWYGPVVAPWVVTPQRARPEGLPPDVPVLLDPDGELEKRYAATTECAYLVRPDFYIGYRSQPANVEGLLDYLRSIFRKS